ATSHRLPGRGWGQLPIVKQGAPGGGSFSWRIRPGEPTAACEGGRRPPEQEQPRGTVMASRSRKRTAKPVRAHLNLVTCEDRSVPAAGFKPIPDDAVPVAPDDG